MDIVYPPLGHETALEVEVGEARVNTSVMAMLEVEAHPLPYFSDIVWTIAREGEEKQVGENETTALERKQMAIRELTCWISNNNASKALTTHG